MCSRRAVPHHGTRSQRGGSPRPNGRPAFQRVADLDLTFLPYGELKQHRSAVARFGAGLEPLDGIACPLRLAPLAQDDELVIFGSSFSPRLVPLFPHAHAAGPHMNRHSTGDVWMGAGAATFVRASRDDGWHVHSLLQAAVALVAPIAVTRQRRK